MSFPAQLDAFVAAINSAITIIEQADLRLQALSDHRIRRDQLLAINTPYTNRVARTHTDESFGVDYLNLRLVYQAITQAAQELLGSLTAAQTSKPDHFDMDVDPILQPYQPPTNQISSHMFER